MDTNNRLGDQLVDLMTAIRRYNDTIFDPKSQENKVSFSSLVWPLLPLLTPEPPKLIRDLFPDAPEKCDVCGKTQGTTFVEYQTPNSELILDTNLADSKNSRLTALDDGLRQRRAMGPKSQLEDAAADVENEMNRTLNDIETTLFATMQIREQNRTLFESMEPHMNDDDFLNRLKALIKEKEERENRVKILETKEASLTESLITALQWAKDMRIKEDNKNNYIESVIKSNQVESNEH